ncbi:ABC transporter ATP-binding protein [Wolbachia endosymbiont of Howardula sp.]|uniref:ABC transporter ATP-binding protein n=1 Tax=Wolbachia endosymbiont of Howardula sp. TaxID=2916816 RepID=UPI00217DA0C3|nr:ABC transporter transmembrane domain-containing protein [Wolbachia endosymbiont of Howardula sp.]UWI83071.1 ATP-binding cassette domain-containing protein [Wolbachia endosymbiont of Howardula sp.]
MQSNIKQLVHYLKPDLWYFIIAFISVLCSALTILLFGQGLSSIIDSSSEHNFTIQLLFAIFIVLGISMTSFIRIYCIGVGSEKFIARVRYDLYSSITDLQPSFFEDTGVQDVISVLITDTSILQSIISSSVLTILRNIITLIGSIIMLLYINIHLTTYTAAVVPMILIIITVLGKRVRNYARAVQDKLSELASLSEENFRSIVTIKSFVLEENEKIKFQGYLNSVSQAYIKLVFLRAIFITLIIACVIGSLVILLFFGIKEVLNHNISVGSLSSFVFYSALAAGAVNNLSDNISDLQKGRAILDRLFELKNMRSSIVNQEYPIKINHVKTGIAFNNVTFSYSGNKLALDNVSFFIEAGQSVSIVGPSGSGKSTILKLLLRFHDPDNGSITIDEHNINSIALNNLRALFGLVPQDHMIFSCTIMENILFGKPNAQYEEVHRAAISAYAMEFIDKLPDQFNTYVGKRGLKLSEGQKQRIIIARAILKNPQILILDEATSALDYESERLVQKALGHLMKNRTTIMITHRLSTAIKTDNIIVMNNKKVEEIGTHDALIRHDGLYAKLSQINK